MTNINCGWCGNEIIVKITKGKRGYGTHCCPECHRMIPSSKITTQTGKHWHRDYRDGDIA